MKIRFCESCGRVILEGFDFCPYCGSCFQRGKAREPQDALEYLDRLIRNLEALDAEMVELESVRDAR